MMTLIVVASHDGIYGAACLMLAVQLHHRRRYDVLQASLPRVVQRALSLVAEAAPDVDGRLAVVCPLPPVGAGALEDGHQ